MSDRMSGILDVIAQALMPSSNPMPAVRPHPGDVADVSALQLAPDMASAFANDVARYGKQAVTGNVSSNEMLNRPDLQGDAATLSDMLGEGVGAVMNYGGLLDGPTVTDIVGGAVDAYQGVKPGLVDAFGEPNVNRAEGAGLLASMMLPSKVRNSVGDMGFYSQAVRASEGLQRKQGNADGFFNDLTGKGQVKPDELNAMGFKKHFAGRSDIPRQEVQQFINENQLQIKETVLGGNSNKPYALYDDDDMVVESFATRAEADAALDAVPQEVFDRGEYWRSGETLGGGSDTSKFGNYTLNGGDNYRELLMQDGSRIARREQMRVDIYDADDRIKTLKHVSRIDPSTDYADELREAVNHRDKLLTQIDNTPSQYVNPNHFEQPDVLAHLRMKDRVDADGNKTLLIEEAQSDWHQTGGDRGYVNKSEYADLVTEERRLNEIVDGTNMNGLNFWGAENAPELAEAITKARVELNAGRNLAFDDPLLDHTEMMEPLHENLRKAKIDLDDAFQADYLKRNGISAGDAYMQAQSDLQILRAELDPMHDAVPDAPFKTDDKSSWYNLAMKRGLIEAAEGDYDKLAFTTGRQQAERYDLSKQINEVRLGGDEQSGFTVSAFDKNDTPVIMESIDSLDALPNLIGKDAAKALIDQPLTDTASGSARVLAGQDLSVGGEGMKQFYDRTLPNTLNKLVKQDGVKVGQSGLPSGRIRSPITDAEFNEFLDLKKMRNPNAYNEGLTTVQLDRYEQLKVKADERVPDRDTVHSINITPEMRDRVKKGLPLFAQGGAVVGAGALFSPDQAHANIMAEDQKLREIGSSSYGKVSPELAEYRRSQLLPSIGEIGMGALEATVDGLDFLSNVPTSISRMQMQNNTPVRDRMQGILDTTFVDQRDKRRIEEARKVGALFSPL